MRFQDAARDARAVVYAGVQADPLVGRVADLLAEASLAERILGRAVMNGMSTDPVTWRTMFPTLFPNPDAPGPTRSEAILLAALAVAERGEQVRQQVRGAIIEALTERLVRKRTRVAPGHVRRERRVLFGGGPAANHPYDVEGEKESGAPGGDLQRGGRGGQTPGPPHPPGA